MDWMVGNRVPRTREPLAAARRTRNGRRSRGPSVAHADRLGSALDFLQYLWRLNHALERVSSRMVKVLGITAQQRLVIRCLGKFPGMTVGQLAGVLHLDPGTVSTTLNRLERQGILLRRRDARDRRRVSLRLTARGRTLDQPAAGTVEHAVERLARTAARNDIARATTLLDRLIRLLLEETR